VSCLVGVDVGDARIGLAVSDGEKKIAFPLGVVERISGSYGFNRISRLIAGRDVEGFVVGLPVKTDGTIGTQAQKVIGYIDAMKKHFGVNVFSWDERFSTAMAERYLRDDSMNAKERKRVVDQIAAQVILQSYLDSLQKAH
jgi:putative Holliday junction resolvase